MRIGLAAAALCLSILSLSVAREATASVRKPTNIPAENLGAALQALAKDRGFQVVYLSDQVDKKTTAGAVGEFTSDEALKRLLSGTGLTYRYLDDKTVTIYPLQTALVAGPSAEGEHADADKKSAGGGSLLAQATPGGTGQNDQTPGSARDQTVKPSKASGDQSKGQGGSGQGEQSVEPYHVNTPEVLIVGSRTMNVDVKRTEDDAQPYYVLDSKQIEQSGATNVEELLKERLTMETTFQSNSQKVGFNGTTSTINLRGLGPNETLILIDGRRAAGLTPSYVGSPPPVTQTDINGIPLSAIERIEILPTSASAIYGGAALGGVVNIILKKNFQGGDVSYVYDNTTETNAPTHTVNATYGFSLFEGKTQIMLSGHYSDGTVLHLGDRLDLVGRGISTILRNSPSYFYNTANPFAGATTNIASADGSNLVLKDGTPLNSPITSIPAGAAPGSNLSAGLLANAGTYNLNLSSGKGEFGLQSPIGTVPREKALTATVRQEISPTLEAFTEVSTKSNIGRSYHNDFNGIYLVPASAPDNPFQQDVNVRFPSALSQPLTTDNVAQAVTVGLIAKLSREWRSELDYTWSRNAIRFASASSFFIDSGAFSSALAAGTVNPFADTIAHPPDLMPYIQPERDFGDSTLNDLGLRLSGPVGTLPWGRPTLTVGLEHRKEGSHDFYSQVLDPANPANDINDVVFGQSQSTDSLYAEALVPLVTEKNAISLVRSLDLQLAGRAEKYRVFAGTAYAFLTPVADQAFNPPQGVHTTIRYTSTNPTIGLKYQPLTGWILRASYARAFLPPTAFELMPNPTLSCGFPCDTITDPRNGQTYGVDDTFGGNPNLQPQTSRSWNLGAVWEPQQEALKGLRMDLEYYKITQPNYIYSPSPQEVVDHYPSRVTRDPTTGLITVVDLSPVNAIEYRTNGWDLGIDYRTPTSFGVFALHAMGTMIEHDKRQLVIGGPFDEYAGYPGDGGEAKIKANTTITWEYRRWLLGWTTTYFGHYGQAGSPGSPSSRPDLIAAQGSTTIPSQAYHEIFGQYTFDTTAAGSGVGRGLLSNLTVKFGVRNLFNRLPPFDAEFGPYFYSAYGDARLRDYRVSVTKGF